MKIWVLHTTKSVTLAISLKDNNKFSDLTGITWLSAACMILFFLFLFWHKWIAACMIPFGNNSTTISELMLNSIIASESQAHLKSNYGVYFIFVHTLSVTEVHPYHLSNALCNHFFRSREAWWGKVEWWIHDIDPSVNIHLILRAHFYTKFQIQGLYVSKVL
jgi:hypothetical protein